MAEGDDRKGDKPSAGGGAPRRPVTLDLSAKEVGKKAAPPAQAAEKPAPGEPAPGEPAPKKPAPQAAPAKGPASGPTEPPIPSAFAPGAAKPDASKPAGRSRGKSSTIGGFLLAAVVGGVVAVGALWLLGQQGLTPFVAADRSTQGAIDETRQALAELQSEIGGTPRDVGALREELGTLQSAIEGLRAEGAGRSEALGAIETLRARIDALEAAPAEAGTDAGADLAGRVDALARQVETLSASPPQAPDAPDLAPRLDALTDRVAAVEARPAPDISPLEARIADIDPRLAAVESGLDALKADLAAGFDALRADAERFATAVARVDALSLHAAVADASAALDAGRPFAAELAALSSLGVDAATIDALGPYAETGIPDAAALAASFDEALAALPANAPPPATASPVDRLFSSARGLVSVRRAGAPPDSAEAASDIRARLAERDYAAALEAWRALPPAAQEETRSFADALQARLDADAALAALRDRALLALSGQSG